LCKQIVFCLIFRNLPMKPPPTPEGAPAATPHDVTLRVKDSLREIRFAAREGARHLATQLTQAAQHAPAWAPPLGEVVRLAAHAVNGLDRLATELVLHDHDYRAMNFRLQPLAQASGTPASLRAMERHCYWLLRHLLQRAQREDVTVHEEALHRACLQFQTLPVPATETEAETAPELQQAGAMAALALCLCESRPLHVHAQVHGLNAQEAEQQAQTLTRSLAVAAVLAGPVAQQFPRAVLQEETQHALDLALQLSRSWDAGFAHAFGQAQVLPALRREMAFVLRHL
jgi:hypothetical protein